MSFTLDQMLNAVNGDQAKAVATTIRQLAKAALIGGEYRTGAREGRLK